MAIIEFFGIVLVWSVLMSIFKTAPLKTDSLAKKYVLYKVAKKIVKKD